MIYSLARKIVKWIKVIKISDVSGFDIQIERIVVNKVLKICQIGDATVSTDRKVNMKARKILEKYHDNAQKEKRTKVRIVPIKIGRLGNVPKIT